MIGVDITELCSWIYTPVLGKYLQHVFKWTVVTNTAWTNE